MWLDEDCKERENEVLRGDVFLWVAGVRRLVRDLYEKVKKILLSE